MIDERIIELLSERLVNRVEQANTYVLEQIGKSIKKVGTLKPTQAQQLGEILKYGGNYDKIVKELAKITKLNIKDIYEIFEEVAKRDYDFAEQFYNYRGKKYIPYDENTALRNQVNALSTITANEYKNMANTLAFAKVVNGKTIYTTLAKTYQDTIDQAILSVSQGKDTFDKEMSRVIKDLSNSGIRVVDYASGYSRRLDSSVRMNIMGGLRDLHNNIQQEIGKEFDSDGVEISVHYNPAPDHEDVQGHQFSNEEFNKFQDNKDCHDYKGKIFLSEYKEGYERRAISEYNCYHYTFSIVLGASKPLYSDKELNEINKNNHKGFKFDGKHYTNYEGTQLQRRIETEVRKTKDEQIMAKASLPNAKQEDLPKIKETITNSQKKITQLTRKYRELSEASGLPTKMQRMKVSGYRRTRV